MAKEMFLDIRISQALESVVICFSIPMKSGFYIHTVIKVVINLKKNLSKKFNLRYMLYERFSSIQVI